VTETRAGAAQVKDQPRVAAEAEADEAAALAEAGAQPAGRPAARAAARDELDEPAFLRRRRMLLYQRR
jgi:hypothetical protein